MPPPSSVRTQRGSPSAVGADDERARRRRRARRARGKSAVAVPEHEEAAVGGGHGAVQLVRPAPAIGARPLRTHVRDLSHREERRAGAEASPGAPEEGAAAVRAAKGLARPVRARAAQELAAPAADGVRAPVAERPHRQRAGATRRASARAGGEPESREGRERAEPRPSGSVASPSRPHGFHHAGAEGEFHGAKIACARAPAVSSGQMEDRPRLSLEAWSALWTRLGARSDPRPLHAAVLARYAEPHRAYHTGEHIAPHPHPVRRRPSAPAPAGRGGAGGVAARPRLRSPGDRQRGAQRGPRGGLAGGGRRATPRAASACARSSWPRAMPPRPRSTTRATWWTSISPSWGRRRRTSTATSSRCGRSIASARSPSGGRAGRGCSAASSTSPRLFLTPEFAVFEAPARANLARSIARLEDGAR